MATGKEWLVRLGVAGTFFTAGLIPQAKQTGEAAQKKEKTDLQTAKDSLVVMSEKLAASEAKLDSIDNVTPPEFEQTSDSTVVVDGHVFKLLGKREATAKDTTLQIH